MAKVVKEIWIKTVSEANCYEYWRVKQRRHKKQQYFVREMFSRLDELPHLPCKITLTRLSPRGLDSKDNLPMSFKWISDEISECLIPEKRGYYIRKCKGKAKICPLKGRADDDERLTWEFSQEKSSRQGIRIEIEEICSPL